jgi:hypothetical protein
MKFLSGLFAASALAITLSATSAQALTITIGDNDGYGVGIADNGATGAFATTGTDNRSPAEAAATDGAQFTDIYSALFPGYGVSPSQTGSFIFSLPSAINAGSLTIDMADFQSSVFGPVAANINGVAFSLFFDDGFQASAVRTFVLTAAQILAINTDGFISLNIDHTGSGDFIAFDYLQANVSPVPVPAALPLLATGLGALGYVARRRSRKAATSA